jgi:hypothetical protein
VPVSGVIVTVAVVEPPFNEAVITADWFTATVPAVAAKLPVIAPAGRVTDVGVVNAVLFSKIVTAAPPIGAAPEIVTVHVELVPDTTEVGVQLKPVTVAAGGVTITDPFAELPFSEAITATAWFAVTVPADTVKVPAVAPGVTITDAGVVNTVLLSEIVTVIPPIGAAAEIITVHVELPPDAIDVGVQVSPVTIVAGGVTVTDALAGIP